MTDGDAPAPPRSGGAHGTRERRWALVTGGGGGLGSAIAWDLAQAGWGVVVNARAGPSLEAARSLVARIAPGPGEALCVTGDAATFAGGRRVAERALARAGRIDAAVLAVGPWDAKPVSLAKVGADDVSAILRGNLEGCLGALTVVVPDMRRRGFGRVITFGMDHIDAAPGWAGRGLYAAAKAALLSLTRTLASEEAAFGITAHMIAPGSIRDALKASPIAAARRRAGGGARQGTGEDVARVVRFLCAEDSDFLTGSVIHVDGGEVIWLPGPGRTPAR